jgi:hypothetical protein
MLQIALADRQREQFVHQQRQSFHTDGISVMQIHRRRRDGVAERRSLLKPRPELGRSLAATRATAAEQSDLGHVRADGGQLDALIDLLRCPRYIGEYRRAFRAGGQQLVDRAIRVRMQRPANAGADFRGGRCAVRAGRSGFCPCEGGFDELPGVFGGRLS